MNPPPDSAPPIVWAVYLGCTTPGRLARERGITRHWAQSSLICACARGLLVRVASGAYRVAYPSEKPCP